jgi:uncharacterized protein
MLSSGRVATTAPGNEALAAAQATAGSASAPSAAEPDSALTEEHWSYMDRFADGMIARGPTLTADRATWTGSVHILDLASADAAHQFVEREPYNRAGLFERHLIRRFKDLLGRTMWDFPGDSDDPCFMVIAHVPAEARGQPPSVPLRDLTAVPRDRLIVHGELLTPDEARPVGVALAVQAPTRPSVDTLLRGGQAQLDEHFDVQILDWEFGGRR